MSCWGKCSDKENKGNGEYIFDVVSKQFTIPGCKDNLRSNILKIIREDSEREADFERKATERETEIFLEGKMIE